MASLEEAHPKVNHCLPAFLLSHHVTCLLILGAGSLCGISREEAAITLRISEINSWSKAYSFFLFLKLYLLIAPAPSPVLVCMQEHVPWCICGVSPHFLSG